MELRTVAEIAATLTGISAISGLIYRSGAEGRKILNINTRLTRVEKNYLTNTRHELLAKVNRSDIEVHLNKIQAELQSDIASLKKDSSHLNGAIEDLKVQVKETSKGLGSVNRSLIKIASILEDRKAANR